MTLSLETPLKNASAQSHTFIRTSTENAAFVTKLTLSKPILRGCFDENVTAPLFQLGRLNWHPIPPSAQSMNLKDVPGLHLHLPDMAEVFDIPIPAHDTV